ncbi:hypothetical protein ACV3ZT_06175 [Clostridium perfringens]|uniref:Uncharacterized protein n=1 Tax=Clostridium perfringens TaxID=1502 RepID=A0AAW9I560_CLOPF|nr:hypothetical protein [Clostridium perfringens]EGT2192499.1 hypothetical protein [Clostridium perfringens]ELC8432774.1 hypothetical protein [Clostridium perfringens]MBI5977073.1 hypothetical protein [Clostridium perfringens]MBI5980092.1 hypothetical protein [Clostridium perfringens]MBI5982732.1 hypothetical protein [Clostridium perfringens]
MIKILEKLNNLQFDDILSIIAIVVSIITLIRTNKANKDISRETNKLSKKIADNSNDINEKIAKNANELNKKIAEKGLNKQFFEEIFFEDIVKNLPNSLDTLEETEDIILSILEKAKFYKYFEKDFYNSIKEDLFEIDEILVDLDSQNREIFEIKREKILAKIESFYEKLRNYYLEI